MAKQRLFAPIDAESMYRKGESFHFAGRFLQQSGLQVIGPSWCAHTTCLAFACEAYLKVLAQLERNEPPFETHNLRELFHDVPPETQRNLRRRWLKDNAVMLKNKQIPMPGAAAAKVSKVKTFEEALDLSAKAFVDWRYRDSAPNYWLVGNLPEIVREYLLKLQPDWRPPAGLCATVLNPHPDFVKPQTEIKPVMLPGFKPLNYKATTFKVQVRGVSDPKDRGSS